MEAKKNLPAKQQVQVIQAFFDNEENKTKLAKAAAKHMDVDRLLRVAMTAIRVNPKLLQCSPESIMACVMGCAQLGLEPEPFLGQAYLVPYWNTKKRAMEAQLIPGYRGYISLARRTGEIQSVTAQVVKKNDTFRLTYGLTEVLEHVPAQGDRGETVGAYCIFRYKDGAHSFDYMTKSDIEAIRKRSKTYNDETGKNSGPWGTDYDEMAKKTVIRRHIKLVPMSVEMSKLAEAESVALDGKSQINLFATTAEDMEAEDVTPADPADFDAILKEHGVSKAQKALVQQFIESTAKANGAEADEVKAEAAGDFDSFWQAFEQWAEANKSKAIAQGPEAVQTPKKEAAPVEPAPQPEPTPAQHYTSIVCPMDPDGTVIMEKVCPNCQEHGQCAEYRKHAEATNA